MTPDDPTTTDDRTDTDLLHKAAMGDADAVDALAVEEPTDTTHDDVDGDTDDVDAASAGDVPECHCGADMTRGVTVAKNTDDPEYARPGGSGYGEAFLRKGYVCPNPCGGAHETLEVMVPAGDAASRGSHVPTKNDVVDVLTADAPRGVYHVRRDADGQTITVHVQETEDLEALDSLLRGRFNREHDDLTGSDGVYILTPNWGGE